MNKEFNPDQLFQQFLLPAQDLTTLSFCKGSRPAVVAAWIQSLPALQIQQTGVQLYQALPEICRFKTGAENRLEMLEALRPYVQQCILGLAKDFLNQPLIMEEKPMKTAVIAQALQKYMCNGYLLVIRDLKRKYKPNKAIGKKLEMACHRFITGAGLLVMRGYQLYSTTPPQLWSQIHGIYQLSEYYDFADHAVNDYLLQEAPACSLTQAYLRVVLLACSRPNQMRQQEVSATYDVLEEWVSMTRVTAVNPNKQENLYLVNLASDNPPLYKSRFTGAKDQELREVDFSQLINALQKHQEHKDSAKDLIKVPHTISMAHLEHLVRAWSTAQQRAFERRPSKDIVDVCVGLKNLHFQITNGIDFEEFLGLTGNEDEFDYSDSDPWATSFNTPPSKDSQPSADTQAQTFSIRVLDSSAGGYCLEWREQIPAQVKAGEILGLREQGRHRWGLGVIRWVQQQRNATRLGIQLLAPKATPYGAAIEQASGDYSDYMRVLMLPEFKAANQAATLITANVPFQEHNNLALNHQGDVQKAQLTRRIFSTGSISQFIFRATEVQQSQPSDSDAKEEEQDFTSVWGDN